MGFTPKFTKIIESRRSGLVRNIGKLPKPANKALTNVKRAGYTLKRKVKRLKGYSNKRKWITDEASAWLHAYIIERHYDGDRERFARGHGLFTIKVMNDVKEAFYKEFPKLVQKYFRDAGKYPTRKAIVTRARFLYVRYTKTRKIDGVRSNEHRGAVP